MCRIEDCSTIDILKFAFEKINNQKNNPKNYINYTAFKDYTNQSMKEMSKSKSIDDSLEFSGLSTLMTDKEFLNDYIALPRTYLVIQRSKPIGKPLDNLTRQFLLNSPFNSSESLSIIGASSNELLNKNNNENNVDINAFVSIMETPPIIQDFDDWNSDAEAIVKGQEKKIALFKANMNNDSKIVRYVLEHNIGCCEKEIDRINCDKQIVNDTLCNMAKDCGYNLLEKESTISEKM